MLAKRFELLAVRATPSLGKQKAKKIEKNMKKHFPGIRCMQQLCNIWAVKKEEEKRQNNG